MRMNDVERQIRFSNISVQECNVLRNHYRTELLEAVKDNPHFLSVFEANSKPPMTRKEMLAEAKKLKNHEDPRIVTFAKDVITFLTRGVVGLGKLVTSIINLIAAGFLVYCLVAPLIIAIILCCVVYGVWETNKFLLTKLDEVLAKNDDNTKEIGKIRDAVQYALRKLDEPINKDINFKFEMPRLESTFGFMDVMNSVDVMVESGLGVNRKTKEIINTINVIENHNNYIVPDAIYNKLDIYGNLAPEHLTYNEVPSMESTMYDSTSICMEMENINGEPLLSGKGLLMGVIGIVTECFDKKQTFTFLNRYQKTVEYEMKNENYADFPILTETAYAIEYAKYKCHDRADVLESCDTLYNLLGEIIESCQQTCESSPNFNPNPFSIGSLTPLPVAQRTVEDVMDDIDSAETDEEITEAMLKLGRVMQAINEAYTIDENNFLILREAKDNINDTANPKESAKAHVTDPMVNFINDQYKKMKDKDSQERKKVILSGGDKVPKIMRWIKRGIGLTAGTIVGTVCPVAGIITAITFIGFICTDKYLDKKERKKIMAELDDEIKICNEKIDDSRGDEDKKKKYELMRIRNSLQRQRDKIQYNLKY